MSKLPRLAIAGLVAGATLVSTAWAGVGLAPVRTATSADDTGPLGDAGAEVTETVTAVAEEGSPAGGLLAGASKVSIEPKPDLYDGYWETDPDKCRTLDPAAFEQLQADPNGHGAHYVTAGGSPWPENPNCLYMGGYGIGPMNPITSWDQEYGLWVRSFALGDGTDTMVLTIIDAEGYLWDYRNKCAVDDDCGSKQIAEELGAELGLEPSSFVIAATHSHTAPDLIGGWGFVPDWYMRQVGDAIRQSIREAVGSMQEAVVEIGEVEARSHNRERRDTYRSAEEQQLTWLRATTAHGPKETIATVGAYAGHPTTRDAGSGVAHADWPATFEKALETRFGGIGLHFMTGLGNMSAAGGTMMGDRLAQLVPEIGGGRELTGRDLAVGQVRWAQPVTNVPLDALGTPGFFDREFLLEPSQVRTGKSPDTAPCLSASPSTVELPVSAFRIGDELAITAAPGEVFSNLTNTLKEQSGAAVTMPLGQANDALGYMPQSFELHPVAQQGLGFVAGGVLIVNYEDSYAVDRCVGDMVLEQTIQLVRSIT